MTVCTARATGAAVVAMNFAPARAFQILEIRVHLSAVGAAANMTVAVENNAGAAYDTILVTQDMTSVTDYSFRPTIPLHFDSGDIVHIAWANGNNVTYGIEIIYNPL